MPDKTWKAYERRISRWFKTTRNSLSGMNSKITASDTLHPVLFIDCKKRMELHGAFRFFKAIENLASKEGKIPVVVLGEPNCRDEDSLVVVRLKNLPLVAIQTERRLL